MQVTHVDRNQSISVENLIDSDYMMVDDLQKLTDEYVMEINSSVTPKPIWRPFIESLFEGIVELDLDKKDKLLIGNLDYLKNVALMLTLFEEEYLGTYVCLIYYLLINVNLNYVKLLILLN